MDSNKRRRDTSPRLSLATLIQQCYQPPSFNPSPPLTLRPCIPVAVTLAPAGFGFSRGKSAVRTLGGVRRGVYRRLLCGPAGGFGESIVVRVGRGAQTRRITTSAESGTRNTPQHNTRQNNTIS